MSTYTKKEVELNIESLVNKELLLIDRRKELNREIKQVRSLLLLNERKSLGLEIKKTRDNIKYYQCLDINQVRIF